MLTNIFGTILIVVFAALILAIGIFSIYEFINSIKDPDCHLYPWWFNLIVAIIAWSLVGVIVCGCLGI